MATKPDFSVDITRNMDVASANPATAARAIEMKGEATKAAIGALGTSLFESYKGAQLGEYEQKQKAELENLQGEMKSLKEGDIANKVGTEKALAGVAAQAEEIRAASILTGADPEEARQMSTVFGQEREAPILAKYRQEQQRLAAIREQMPEREKEFMLRSESLLRSYITKLPGLANAFRGISQEVTGQKNIELYSVSNLYQEIDYIEKQKEAAAKEAQQATDSARKRYIKDRAPLVGEVQAAAEFDSMSPSEIRALAAASVQIENTSKANEQALKAGGAGIKAFVTNSVSRSQLDLLSASSSIAVDLEKFGVTRTQLATGALTSEQLSNPKIKEYLLKAADSQIRLIDAAESEALKSLLVTTGSSPVDADAASKARTDLMEYYKNAREDVRKNGVMSYVSAFADNSDPTKTMQQRFTLVETIRKSLGIPEDVAKNLASSDRSNREREYARYPQWAAAYQYYEKVLNGAQSNLGPEKWVNLLNEFNKVKDVEAPPIPVSGEQSAANVLQFQTVASSIVKDATSSYTPVAQDNLRKFVNVSMSTGNNASLFLEKYSSSATQIKANIPASEQPQFNSEVQKNYNNYVYGEGGHANSAYKRALEYKDSNAANLMFTDYTGNAPLKFRAEYTPEALAEAANVRPGVYVAPVGVAAEPKGVNAVLATIDKNIRIRSLMTGETVASLRKEFMATLQQQGRPSEVFTKIVSRPPTEGTGINTTPTGGVGINTPIPSAPAARDWWEPNLE